MRILTFTNLFPNSVRPRHGLFVEQRLRRLVATGRLEACVVAPVPWFPSQSPRFGAWSDFARVPRHEIRGGIDVFHPRYPVIPKVGMSLAPLIMATALRGLMRSLVDQRGIDLIDAHYFFPDGVAAVLLARALKKPVVVSARGSDINILPRHALPRRWIRWAATECNAAIAVSDDLRRRLCELGVSRDKVVALRNGVDLEQFRPLDRGRARAAIGATSPLLLSVGNLIRHKGHHLVIRALAELPGAQLVIIGSGPDAARLQSIAASAGVSNRVRFVQYASQQELVRYYSAADVLVLASASEGMPNVVLESIACGTPVIATPTGGAVEIMSVPEAGVLLKSRTAPAIVEAFNTLVSRAPSRAETRRHAGRFGWDDVVARQLELYANVVASAQH